MLFSNKVHPYTRRYDNGTATCSWHRNNPVGCWRRENFLPPVKPHFSSWVPTLQVSPGTSEAIFRLYIHEYCCNNKGIQRWNSSHLSLGAIWFFLKKSPGLNQCLQSVMGADSLVREFNAHFQSDSFSAKRCISIGCCQTTYPQKRTCRPSIPSIWHLADLQTVAQLKQDFLVLSQSL